MTLPAAIAPAGSCHPVAQGWALRPVEERGVHSVMMSGDLLRVTNIAINLPSPVPFEIGTGLFATVSGFSANPLVSHGVLRAMGRPKPPGRQEGGAGDRGLARRPSDMNLAPSRQPERAPWGYVRSTRQLTVAHRPRDIEKSTQAGRSRFRLVCKLETIPLPMGNPFSVC